MHCRPLTRLTNAFSKKFENFEAAVGLNFAYYNSARCTALSAALRQWKRASRAANGQLRNWSNAMANKRDYLDRLKLVIEHLHKCSARHVWTDYIKEEFNGKTLWKGPVEVFNITGHPKAKRCYGWSYGEPEEFITILELPPVDSAQSAVKVGIDYQVRKARSK